MSVRVDVAEEPGKPDGLGWLAWLVWLVLALLLGLAFWLLLGACGIRMLHGMPLLAFCPAPAATPAHDPALGAEVARQRALEAEIDRLQLALLGAPRCRPLAQTEVTPPPAPVPAPAPTPPPAPDAIPEQAWNQRDTSFLEGCWDLETDYQVRNQRTGELRRAKTWQVCFDAQGQGQQTLTFDDGTQCTGPMLGKFGADGRLQLNDAGDLPCADGFRVFERHTSCERVDAAHARCDEYQPRTGGRGDVTFRHRAEAGQ